jgi:plastocyanin
MPHNWFIDFNGNNHVDPGEVSSPDFSSSTNAVVFNFTVPTDRVGLFEYVCRFHPTTMRGQIVILTPPEITLYGSQVTGWGSANNTTANPGPALYMLYGTNLTIHLISLDGPAVDHTWFVDYSGDGTAKGEQTSALFNSTAPSTYVYTPDRTGNFAYRCSIHPTTMTGTIVILGNAPAPASGFKIDLIPGIMIAVIIAVLVLAAVYQVRAVRAARRPK